MALKIRLTRLGDKGNAYYRFVVAEGRNSRDGKFVEILGTYDPGEPDAAKAVKVDGGIVQGWIAKGAQPTDTAKALLVKAGAIQPKPFKPKMNAKPPKVKAKKKENKSS